MKHLPEISKAIGYKVRMRHSNIGKSLDRLGFLDGFAISAFWRTYLDTGVLQPIYDQI